MARTPFTGPTSDDRLYCPRYDMWVQEQANGEVPIGATSFGIFLAGEIIAFTSKPQGAAVEIGRCMRRFPSFCSPVMMLPRSSRNWLRIQPVDATH